MSLPCRVSHQHRNRPVLHGFVKCSQHSLIQLEEIYFTQTRMYRDGSLGFETLSNELVSSVDLSRGCPPHDKDLVGAHACLYGDGKDALNY